MSNLDESATRQGAEQGSTDHDGGLPALSRDRESPLADNEVAEEISETVLAAEDRGDVPPDHHVVMSSRGAVETGVTPAMQIASAWSWRFLVIVAAVVVVGYGVRYVSEVVIPVVVGVLLCALLAPVTNGLQKLRIPRGGAAGITVVATLAVVAGLLTLVGTQIAAGFSDLSTQVGEGVRELRDLARINLNITDQQITDATNRLRDTLTSGGAIGQRAAEVGTTATHFFAGLFIALFCLFFFLYQGEKIWAWVVRLFPLQARKKADSSGRKAWISLTAFVRATIIVAAVDAIGISLGAAILGLPLVSAIGILVFVGAFVPVVGALVSGSVAVLVALVAKGPLVAIIMLGVVIGVQQLEAHVLQPFLLGRAVSLHPLAVILAIATGVVIAGIVGALVAVPAAAVLNTIVSHLAGSDVDPEPPRRRSRPPAADTSSG
jgi:predicted PurR-regulated permease PerM